MYQKLHNLVIGFHGCNKETWESVLLKSKHIKDSANDYDWLGHGQYFWECNYDRALSWAKERKFKNPSVIGATIDLGRCLNLTDEKSIIELKNAYKLLKEDFGKSNIELPKNINVKNNADILLRRLDCTVIQYLHQINKDANLTSYDSIRGVFIEGDEIYPDSGIKTKTHIQICVVNPNCIMGYFDPRKAINDWPIP